MSKGSGSAKADFKAGDVVLGKIKGYPPWPGILCSEDEVPKANVLNQRPGKSYFIVRFFPAADYGFNKAHELRHLTQKEIEAFLGDPHRRAAELREAYKLAREPAKWQQEQNEIVKEAEEAEREEKDQLADDDGDEEDAKPPPKKKRKSSPAAPTSAASSAKPKTSPSHPATAAPTSATAAAAADGEEPELDPETKKVKAWRHALQRGFLPKDGNLNAGEMDTHDKTFKQVEEYEQITVSQLRLTKIGKVMKRILQLSDIPRDEEYHFRQRAQKLCDKWGEVMARSQNNGSTGAGETSGAADD